MVAKSKRGNAVQHRSIAIAPSSRPREETSCKLLCEICRPVAILKDTARAHTFFCARSGTSPSGSLGLLLCARRHWCTVTAQAAGSEISAGKARAGLYKLSCCLSCIMT